MRRGYFYRKRRIGPERLHWLCGAIKQPLTREASFPSSQAVQIDIEIYFAAIFL